MGLLNDGALVTQLVLYWAALLVADPSLCLILRVHLRKWSTLTLLEPQRINVLSIKLKGASIYDLTAKPLCLG
jgi:hypothetical protein